jgi:hypothetical protein
MFGAPERQPAFGVRTFTTLITFLTYHVPTTVMFMSYLEKGGSTSVYSSRRRGMGILAQ